jgi:NAD(P)H-quinone oxidoreductase subunit 5
MLNWALPLMYLLGAVSSVVARGRSWSIATVVSVAGLAASIAAIASFAGPAGSADPLGAVMAVLVAFLGWVIVAYSRRYLAGEPGQDGFVGALLFTLAAVATVVLTRHLGILVAAWAASSLGLHHLLTFYRDRASAQIVAHKKFLASRMAELCLVAALVLIFRETGTLAIDGIIEHVDQSPTLSPGLHAAVVLIALAAILKSAQLPLHGWLIQVMEAPTPVSALLHAGIVNIGGFVLIRLADLLSAAPLAQILLVVVGSLTAVLAGLVMMTRISVKVRLAWSTCAQMGFMLMECGLGFYELALLHLIAHSLYKAHAFLRSGDTVMEVRRRDLAPVAATRAPHAIVWRRILAVPVAIALVLLSLELWRLLAPGIYIHALALIVVALGLAPLLWETAAESGRALVSGVASLLLVTQLYVLWHLGFATVVGPLGSPLPWFSVWVGACFGALYLLQVWLLAYPRGMVARALYPRAYAGFYLDERFTRLTFRVWPARVEAAPANSLRYSSFHAGDTT